jgi:uncharacterized membrane protein required for colicin V production
MINPVDFLLGLLVLANIGGGWRRGLIRAGANLLALVFSVLLALVAYPGAAAFAGQHGLHWAASVTFLIAFAFARAVLGAFKRRLLYAVPRRARYFAGTRSLGAIAGGANGLIKAAVVSVLLLTLPLKVTIVDTANQSLVAKSLAGRLDWLAADFHRIDAVRKHAQRDPVIREPLFRS